MKKHQENFKIEGRKSLVSSLLSGKKNFSKAGFLLARRDFFSWQKYLIMENIENKSQILFYVEINS